MKLGRLLIRARVLGAFVAIVVALAGLSSTAGVISASASVTCYATSCAGHDPTTHGCSATSTTTTAGSLATVWNRYSAGCDSNWVRGQLSAAAVRAGDQMNMSIYTYEPGNNEEYMAWPTYSPDDQGHTYEFPDGTYSGSAIAYSDMVDGTYKTYAEISVFDSSENLLTTYEADQ